MFKILRSSKFVFPNYLDRHKNRLPTPPRSREYVLGLPRLLVRIAGAGRAAAALRRGRRTEQHRGRRVVPGGRRTADVQNDRVAPERVDGQVRFRGQRGAVRAVQEAVPVQRRPGSVRTGQPELRARPRNGNTRPGQNRRFREVVARLRRVGAPAGKRAGHQERRPSSAQRNVDRLG